MSHPNYQERLMTVVLGPHVSEKSTAAADKRNQVVLKVRLDASKREIRDAVQLMFEVKVEDVRVVRILGKIKRHGLTRGRQSTWKKAYVRLAAGEDIAFMGAE